MPCGPSISTYTQLLHCHGVGSDQAEEYKKKNSHHKTFLNRTVVMDRVFTESDPHRSAEYPQTVNELIIGID